MRVRVCQWETRKPGKPRPTECGKVARWLLVHGVNRKRMGACTRHKAAAERKGWLAVDEWWEDPHARRGIVSTHPRGAVVGTDAHAATECCGADVCVPEALLWVEAMTGLTGTYEPDPERPAPRPARETPEQRTERLARQPGLVLR